MARFFGKVGYGYSVEAPPGSGNWVDQINERDYQGDVVRNFRRLASDEKVNSDIVLSNSISVIADQYAIEHSYLIKYVRWAGVCWVVNSVDVQSPRLILNLGSVYNGPTP